MAQYTQTAKRISKERPGITSRKERKKTLKRAGVRADTVAGQFRPALTRTLKMNIPCYLIETPYREPSRVYLRFPSKKEALSYASTLHPHNWLLPVYHVVECTAWDRLEASKIALASSKNRKITL